MHDGKTNNEAVPVIVTRKKTGSPIFYRAVLGIVYVEVLRNFPATSWPVASMNMR